MTDPHPTPTLTGSPKQIAWAEKIRTKTIALMRGELEVIKGMPEAEIAAIADLAALRTDARWWIDNQHLLASGTIQDHMLMKAAGLVDKAGVLTEAGVIWTNEHGFVLGQ